MGCFAPLRKDELDIVIKSGRHKKTGQEDAPTISHEHLHLLQSRNPKEHLRNARFPERLLTERGCAEAYLLYLLQKDELEARLHEIVLSFYRSYRYLPTSVSGFLAMIAATPVFADYMQYLFGGTEFLIENQVEKFPIREIKYAEELSMVFAFMKSHELERRFWMEVMTVLYGNLLRCYGDGRASSEFLAEIQCADMYNEQYGVARADLPTVLRAR